MKSQTRRKQQIRQEPAEGWRDRLVDTWQWVVGIRPPKYRQLLANRRFRRVNARRLVGVVLVILCVGGVTAVFHQYQVRLDAVDLQTHVERCEQSGDLAGVDRYLYLYVQLVPSDSEALIRLSELRFERGNSPDAKLAATMLLSRGLSREPDRNELRLILARQLVELGRHKDAAVHLQALLEADPDQPEIHALFAETESTRGRYSESAAAYRKAIELDAARISNYIGLAELLHERLSRPADADAVMDEAVTNNPKSVDAYLAKSRYSLKYRSRAMSRADAQAALQIDANHFGAIKLAAQVEIDDLQFEAAHEFLARALSAGTKDGEIYLLLSKLHIAEGHAADAIAVIRAGIEKLGPSADLLWNLASLLSADANWEEVQQIINQLSAAGVATRLVDYLRAGLLFERGKYLQAARIYERVLAAGGDPEVNARAEYYLGGCYHMMGQPDESINRYRRAARLRSNWSEVRWGLASELAIAGRFEESLTECEVGRTLSAPTPAQWALYLKLLIRRERLRPSADRSWDACVRVGQKALHDSPDSPAIRIAISDLLRAQTKPQEAIDWLTQSVEHSPGEIELRIALSSLLDRAGEKEKAGAVLDETENDLGDSVALRVARANRLEYNETASERLRALRDGIEEFSEADQIMLIRGLGYACLRRGLLDLTKEYIEQLADRADYDLSCRLLLYDLALRTRDDEALKKWLDQIRAIEGPHGVLWRYGEASRILTTDERGGSKLLQRAWDLLQEARAIRPAWGKIYLNIARIEELQNRPDRAIDAYQSAVELGEHHPDVLSRVVQLLTVKGRFLEADRMIRRLAEESPLPIEMHRLAAEVFAKSRDYEAAVEQAVRYAEGQPKDYRSHVWLGQLLRIVGRSEEAEAALRKAVQVQPQEAGSWVPLVLYLSQARGMQDAQDAIAQAKSSLSPEEADKALAVCFEAVDDMEQAEMHYRAAASRHSNDSTVLQLVAEFYVRRRQWDEAETFLRRAYTLDPQTAAIRRGLVLVLLARGDYPGWQEAMELINLNLEKGNNAANDIRVKAVLLAARGGARLQKEASTLLEYLVEQASANPGDRYLLAQLYYARGDNPKGRDQMLYLLAQHPDDRTYLATYIKSLLDRADTREAQMWLRRLEEIDPKSPQTITLKVQCLVALGNTVEAASLLEEQASDISSTGENSSVLIDIAQLFERIGEEDAAGEAYRQLQAIKPEGAVPLSQWLARHGKIEEALAVSDKAWQTLPPDDLAIPTALIVRSGQASEEQQKRVESRLLGAMKEQPNSISLRHGLALLRDSQQRYAEAASIYEEILRLDPKNLVALNNLAWLQSQCLKRPAAGLAVVEEAIRLYGPQAGLLDTRGVIRVEMGQFAKAVEDLEEAYVNARKPTVAFHLAVACHKAGQKDRARELFRTFRSADAVLSQLHTSERAGFHQLATALNQTPLQQ